MEIDFGQDLYRLEESEKKLPPSLEKEQGHCSIEQNDVKDVFTEMQSGTKKKSLDVYVTPQIRTWNMKETKTPRNDTSESDISAQDEASKSARRFVHRVKWEDQGKVVRNAADRRAEMM